MTYFRNMKRPDILDHIVIVGNNYECFLTALFLQRKLAPLDPSITIIETKLTNHGHQSRFLSTLGSMREFHKEIGISEQSFINQTNATFNLGYKYESWQGYDSLVCDSETGFIVNGIKFQHLFHQFQKTYNDSHYDDFSLAAQLAKKNRFTPPSPNPHSIFKNISYGYNLTTERYCTYLKKLCHKKNINIISSPINGIQLGENDKIVKLILDNKTEITASFYIDCTHEQQLVKHQTQRKQDAIDINMIECSVNITDSLSTNNSNDEIPPYATLTKQAGSIIKKIPLRNKAGIITYQQKSDNDKQLGNTCTQDCTYELTPWFENCIAMSEAFSVYNPLFIDRSHLHQSALLRFLTFLPTMDTNQELSYHYNKNTIQELASAADICALHYNFVFSSSSESGLKNEINNKLQVFGKTGNIPIYENELLNEYHWISIFYALGIYQENDNILASVASHQEACNNELEKIMAVFNQASGKSPLHSEFLKKIQQ